MSDHTSFNPLRQWKGENNELGSIGSEMAQGRSGDFLLEKVICMQPGSPATKPRFSALRGLVGNKHGSVAGLLTASPLASLQPDWYRLGNNPFSSEQPFPGRREAHQLGTRWDHSYCSCFFSAINGEFSASKSLTLVISKVKLENQAKNNIICISLPAIEKICMNAFMWRWVKHCS